MVLGRKENSFEVFVQFFVVFSALSYDIQLFNKFIVFVINLFLLIVIILKRILEKRFVFYLYYFDFWWLLFLVIFLLNRDPDYASFASAFLILGLLSMVVFRDNAASYRGALIAIIMFATLNLLANFLNIVSYKSFLLLTNFLGISISVDGYANLTGLFSDIGRNAYCAIIGLSVSSILLISKYRKKKSLLWLFSIMMLMIVVSTGKLGHAIFLVITIIAIYIIQENSLSRKLARALLMLIFSVLLISLAFLFFPDMTLLTRTLSKITSGDISSGRINIWEISFRLFLQNPLLGIGYGGFTVNSLQYTGIAIYAGVHNDYLQWLTETGIIGFSINMVILIGIYSLSLRILRSINNLQNGKHTFHKTIILWSIFIQTFVILYSFTGIPHFTYEINNIYLLSCGIPFSLLRLVNKEIYSKKVFLALKTSNTR